MKTIALFLIASIGWATTLTGSLNGPDGSGLNGFLYLALSQQAALSSAGSCGGPALILPNYGAYGGWIRITVAGGALQSPPTLAGNDCLLPSGTYYNVKATDIQGNQLFTDKWIIQGASQNIGQIVSVVVSGTTQTLGGVGVILTQPSGAQAIAQPGSTYLSVNNLNPTSLFQFPDTSLCNGSGCIFNQAAGFIKGLATSLTQPSTIWIGGTGNFYVRTFTGGDASCTGVLDGWMGIRLDDPHETLELCRNGHTYGVPLTFIQ